jgi:hypothetical protein
MLQKLRGDRGWDINEVARRIRAAGKDASVDVADFDGLVRMIRSWQRGRHGISERYQLLIRTAFGLPAVSAVTEVLPEQLMRVAAASRRPQLSEGTAEALQSVLMAMRCAEDKLGASAMRKPVLAQLTVIENLLREIPRPCRLQLLDVAQQWAQFAAYLYRDAQDATGERAWLVQALEWAHEVGDVTMISTTLTQLGDMALVHQVDAAKAAGLAQAARQDGKAAPGQLAEAAYLEARALACMGDCAGACRVLGDAERLAARLTPIDRRRPWLYWMTPGFFRCQEGRTFSWLAGRPGNGSGYRYVRRTLAALGDGYAALPAEYQSSAWGARNLARLASVHAWHGVDLEAADGYLRQAAGIARVTSSERLASDLRHAYQRLQSRWPDHPRVAGLREALG